MTRKTREKGVEGRHARQQDHGEGGGQVVRTSLALSAITGQAVRIEKIRAGRHKPGLRPQHVTGVRAIAKICDAQVEGAKLNSQELAFAPRSAPRAGRGPGRFLPRMLAT